MKKGIEENRKLFQGNKVLEQYLSQLKKCKKKVGSIVMNCNPFTLGHRYLIEQAKQYVDMLYIFVVEEDRSAFSFYDRMNMVKAGVEDLCNVEVLPSGKFIISAQTFPGYFHKESPRAVHVDTSTDIKVFGEYIVPVLGIDVRFVGEEPLDPITRQYNCSMKELLPSYGVEVKEFSRKKIGDQLISASEVRKALKRKDFSQVKQMVPLSTWEYIKKMDGNINEF